MSHNPSAMPKASVSHSLASNRGLDNLRLDRQLCFALYAATHAMTRAYRRELADVGLTYPQYLLMLVLWEQDEASVSVIADTLDLDAATVTPLVKRLEAAGLVARLRIAGDDRIVCVKVQPKGWAIRERVAQVQKRIACRTGLEDAAFERLKTTLLEVAHCMKTAPRRERRRA